MLDVPPIDTLLVTVNVLAKLTAPFTLNVLFKCVAPSIVAVEDTFNVPPTCAFETDILPEIGIPVIFVPSPKNAEAQTFSAKVALPPTPNVPVIVVLPATVNVLAK